MSEIIKELTTNEKLKILADAAKYDVACTSSGVDRKGEKGALGNSVSCGICHSFAADGRCISLLKVLMTNHCVYDCKYCLNRKSNDVPRTAFAPEELCDLVVEFYKRNYIEGLFLSSGVMKNPTYTMQLMCEALYMLRTKYRFNGYIHVKTIPGAPDELISMVGYLADRVSVNMELPTEEGLERLAPNKSFKTILDPMGKLAGTIQSHRLALGKSARMERSSINRYLTGSIFNEKNLEHDLLLSDLAAGQAGLPGADKVSVFSPGIQRETACVARTASGIGPSTEKRATCAVEAATGVGSATVSGSNMVLPPMFGDTDRRRPFAPAGQSTQMIVGADGGSDYTLIHTAQRLYQSYDLKRVFYSAYIPINDDSALPSLGTDVPLLREHRLYQADWLLRYYGFRADEIVTADEPNLDQRMDPKCNWAVRHLDQFPVEVQTAPYDLLLRIPGIGPKSAARIVRARRYGSLDFDSMKKMGVVLKRAHYFITCGGRMMYRIPIERDYIVGEMTDMSRRENWQVTHQNEQYRQMTLFDIGLQGGSAL